LHAHFTQLAQQLIQKIAQATRSIHVAVCWFTLPELLEALMNAQQRGVRVAFLINFDQLNFGQNTLPFGKLLALGAKGWLCNKLGV
jgi:phosphatidylserine/phosphatidylglycerophosphate/cardiolipin synthase-like enzyme